jgi:hypothetical protein
MRRAGGCGSLLEMEAASALASLFGMPVDLRDWLHLRPMSRRGEPERPPNDVDVAVISGWLTRFDPAKVRVDLETNRDSPSTSSCSSRAATAWLSCALARCRSSGEPQHERRLTRSGVPGRFAASTTATEGSVEQRIYDLVE